MEHRIRLIIADDGMKPESLEHWWPHGPHGGSVSRHFHVPLNVHAPAACAIQAALGGQSWFTAALQFHWNVPLAVCPKGLGRHGVCGGGGGGGRM